MIQIYNDHRATVYSAIWPSLLLKPYACTRTPSDPVLCVLFIFTTPVCCWSYYSHNRVTLHYSVAGHYDDSRSTVNRYSPNSWPNAGSVFML